MATSAQEPDINRLMECYSAQLMRLCYLYLKDYQQAQEAVQDTLYKAYVKYGSFGARSSEKTWITKIAINTCRDYLRKSSRSEIVSSECVELSAAHTPGPETSDDSVVLLNAVYRLPPSFREVVLMRYYQDLSVKEIAKILHVRPNTVSVRLNRAIAQLKGELKE